MCFINKNIIKVIYFNVCKTRCGITFLTGLLVHINSSIAYKFPDSKFRTDASLFIQQLFQNAADKSEKWRRIFQTFSPNNRITFP